MIEHQAGVREQRYRSSAVVPFWFYKAGTTDVLIHGYVCVWAEGAPPQDYLGGERLGFTSGGCYVGERASPKTINMEQ